MSAAHQTVRIDGESRASLTPEVAEAVATAIKADLPSADVVVVSDCAKGLCNDRVIRTLIETAAEAGKATIIGNFAIYRDATLIKPNRRDLTDATGLPSRH